jgi:pyruvate,orthophosphate dikinase
MFLGDRRVLIERVILAKTSDQREAALAALLPLQRSDFIKILEEMDGLSTTIRLLDPPLHEFLPDISELRVKSALNRERNTVNEDDDALLHAVELMHESNPMLGLRGVRLGLVSPGLYELQVRAIAEAMAELITRGLNPRVEIMIPLVGSHMELRITRTAAEQVIQKIAHEKKLDLPIEIGTMIELPRAALTANRIGPVADFFSFGTNDLTQTTWGFSRDDVEAEFFSRYFELGVFTISPFETIDEFGVGELVKIAAERGRSVNPNLHLGVCGEHGGDPESIHFFHSVGLDYVSCSPFRVPIARLEAGRASINNPDATSLDR